MRFLWGVATQGLFLWRDAGQLGPCGSAGPLRVQPCGLPRGGGLLGAPVWLRQPGLTKPRGESWPGLPLCSSSLLWSPALLWGSRRGAGRGSGGESLRPHTLCAFSWQETHWGETLRVSQMWKVLLSEGEPCGARSPELHEPLRTGTCGLAQDLWAEHAGFVFLPSERGPQETVLDRTVNPRELGCPWVPSSPLPGIPGGHIGPKSRRDLVGGIWGLPCGPRDSGEGVSKWGNGCWKRPPARTPWAGPCDVAN